MKISRPAIKCHVLEVTELFCISYFGLFNNVSAAKVI